MKPPIRRIAAIDAGSRRLKFLLAETDFGRLRILKTEVVDLQEEGLVSADEIKSHLQGVLDGWGRPPLALALPQHLSISQTIDLPQAPESEVRKLIEDEARKLSGVSESRVIHDFVRVESASGHRQQFWVTLCRESDVLERIQRLGLDNEDICEVTTTANALVAAWRATHPLSSRAILVHLGAQSTVVVILVEGQGVFATSFQMGGDFFTRSLARLSDRSEETADELKRSGDLLNGPDAISEFASVVDGWVAELKRQLGEWYEQHREVASSGGQFEMIASGGGFEQPGLLEYLKSNAGLHLRPWAAGAQPDATAAPQHFEVAFGTALQALGHSTQPVSLLPEKYRAAWKKRLGRQRLDFASATLALVCLLILALGTWHKLATIRNQQALLDKVQAGLESVQANAMLSAELVAQFEQFRPLFARQQNTVDVLRSLTVLQQVRTNQSFWYVLLADQNSYFGQPAQASTNRIGRTNLVSTLSDPSVSLFQDWLSPTSALTNGSVAKPGLIAELSIPENAENARRALSQLVSNLNQEPIFARVDLLSDDLRRNLADPKVTIPNRHFVLALDFAETGFQPRTRRSAGAAPPPRRPARTSWLENGERSAVNAP